MPSTDPPPPTTRVLDYTQEKPALRVCYKPLPNVQHGGCHLEVYPVPGTPTDVPTPLVLLLHGGGWTMGGPSSVPFEQIRWLRARGIAAASADVKMKDMRQDVLDAYRFAVTKLNPALTAAGLRPIDPQRVGGWGASAGGTLVIYLGADVAADRSVPPLRAIIPVYPAADFTPFQRGQEGDASELIAKNLAAAPEFKKLYDELLAAECVVDAVWPKHPEDGTPEINKRHAFSHQALHNNLLVPMLFDRLPLQPSDSPLGVLSASFPPTCVVVAGADQLLPPAQSHAVVDRLTSLGVDAQAAVAHDLPHGLAEMLPHQPEWPEGNTWWQDAVEPSLEFMARYLTK